MNIINQEYNINIAVPSVFLVEFNFIIDHISPMEAPVVISRITLPDCAPYKHRDEIKSQGRKAVVVYMDVMKDLKTFITDCCLYKKEYMPAACSQWGVYAWDSSNDYYRACLKWHLSFEMSPEDVYNLGIQEVDKIMTAMHKPYSCVCDAIAVSSSKTYILQFHNDTVFKRINPKLCKLIEASSSDGLGGGYSSAPLFEAMAFSLHEANPGHHMQHSYSIKADLPDFRRDPMVSILFRISRGSKFNIQEFHLQVLENGAMPMSVLESLIKRWIQNI
ncbi:hypothetical protein MAR_014485, partial [Mya arenaria]